LSLYGLPNLSDLSIDLVQRRCSSLIFRLNTPYHFNIVFSHESAGFFDPRWINCLQNGLKLVHCIHKGLRRIHNFNEGFKIILIRGFVFSNRFYLILESFVKIAGSTHALQYVDDLISAQG
jgi:hypothetical protein